MLLVVFLVMRQDMPGGNVVSVLALFAYTGFRVVPSANRIMLNVGYMREAHPWVRNMDDDMRKLRVPRGEVPTSTTGRCCSQSLACEDVSFGYEGGPPLALDGISFTIERGRIGRHRRADRRRQEHAGRRAAGTAAADDRPRADRRRTARRPRARLAAAGRLRVAGRVSARRHAPPQHRIWHP